MWSYILKRVLLMIPTLFGILAITFAVIQFVPGGPVEQMVHQLQGRNAAGEGPAAAGAGYRGRQGVDAARIAEIRRLYGFDKPVHTRFDTATTLLVLAGYAIPSFVLGVLMMVLFAGGTFVQWFPLRGLTSGNWDQLSLMGKVTDYLWHIVLPVTAMVMGSFAVITIMTKNSVLEEIHKQYVLTARAKGVGERAVMWRHVFRNALIPIMTGFPAAFVGAFFSSSLLIETLFSLDGLGLLSYESVIRRDYPVVLGTLFFFTLIGLVTTLIRDLSYLWVDPRVKYD